MQIAPILTKEKQKSYHEITKRMHARFMTICRI